MKNNISDRMMLALIIATISSAGISMAADGPREPQEEQKHDQYEKPQEQKQQQERGQRKIEQDQKQQQGHPQQKQQEQERAQRPSEQDREQQQHQQQDQKQKQNQQQERAQQQQRQDHDQQQKQQQRLSQQQQKKLITQQQQRVAQYRQHLEQQDRLAQQNAQLQQQKRLAQYRFQEQYQERVRQQQIHLRDDRFDYDRDPYFYTAPTYRYNRGGKYYETNEYGAKTLRQAVNYGYDEGFRAGQADREDHWRSNYKESYAYKDANYGYSGYYIDRSDYNYYFREGFHRGYEDGYNSRYQYGRFSDGNYSILNTILSEILNFQALR